MNMILFFILYNFQPYTDSEPSNFTPPNFSELHIYCFLACDSIYAIACYMLSPVRPSVRPSITRVDQSKTVEVRVTKPSPQSSPMTLVS